MTHEVHAVTFDRNDPDIRQAILMRFAQLTERILDPTGMVMNPTSEIDNLFDLLEFGRGTMLEPAEIGARVLDRPGGSVFVKVGTRLWMKANPDTTPVFPVPWEGLLNPQPVPDPEPPVEEEEPPV